MPDPKHNPLIGVFRAPPEPAPPEAKPPAAPPWRRTTPSPLSTT